MAEIDYNAATAHPIALRTSGQSTNPAHHKPHADTAEYERLYKESVEHPTQFWDRVRPVPPLRAELTWADGARAPLLAPSVQDGHGRLVRRGRRAVVPRGRPQRVVQLRRPLGVQAPQQGTWLVGRVRPSSTCSRTCERPS